ncbi:hypothetical protein ACQP00_37980 [Dactylosporangium sp. CS-047395]|uniref:hypothetical protein n=1 Tax=Dactylosporangium sp. CS-047395 TaxID=3239936 RepID=UPI003D9262C9
MTLTPQQQARNEFNKRLDDWQGLADVLEIPGHQRRRFPRGEEPREIWMWLDSQNRLGELPDALVAIGRTDLADLLRASAPVTAPAPRARRRRRLWPVIAAGAALVVAGGLVLVLTRPWNQPKDKAKPEPSSGSVAEIEARIDKTWDVETNKYVGVRSYADPTEAGRGAQVGSYAQGDTIYVLCQNPAGREVRDAKWSDRPESTRLWYRLSAPGPVWVPSMYVRLLSQVVPPTCP